MPFHAVCLVRTWDQPTGPDASEWRAVDLGENEREPAATRMLRKFLLEKSAASYRFAMLLYWCLLASIEAAGGNMSPPTSPDAKQRQRDAGNGKAGHGGDRRSGGGGKRAAGAAEGGAAGGAGEAAADRLLSAQLDERAEVARRLAKLVVHWAARGRQQQLEVAAAAAGTAGTTGQLFPEQGAFGLRRQHAFAERLVTLAERLRFEEPGKRRAMVVRELEALNREMLPAALLAPTAAHRHLLLRVQTSAPAEPVVFSTKVRSPRRQLGTLSLMLPLSNGPGLAPWTRRSAASTRSTSRRPVSGRRSSRSSCCGPPRRCGRSRLAAAAGQTRATW
eukprot:SAG22_NODE_26_length_29806_cov_19.885381_13_plen_334_part_00